MKKELKWKIFYYKTKHTGKYTMEIYNIITLGHTSPLDCWSQQKYTSIQGHQTKETPSKPHIFLFKHHIFYIWILNARLYYTYLHRHSFKTTTSNNTDYKPTNTEHNTILVVEQSYMGYHTHGTRHLICISHIRFQFIWHMVGKLGNHSQLSRTVTLSWKSFSPILEQSFSKRKKERGWLRPVCASRIKIYHFSSFLSQNKLAAINSFTGKSLNELGEELSKHDFETCRSSFLILVHGFFTFKSTSNGSSFAICLTSKEYAMRALTEVLFHEWLKMLQKFFEKYISLETNLK